MIIPILCQREMSKQHLAESSRKPQRERRIIPSINNSFICLHFRNIIDVSAMDAHSLEPQEYNDRVKLYNHRLAQQWYVINFAIFWENVSWILRFLLFPIIFSQYILK